MDLIEKLKTEGFRRRLSPKTILAYAYWVKRFQQHMKIDLHDISKRDIRLYIEHLSKKGHAGKTLNLALNSLRFLVEEVMNKRWRLNITYSRISKRLPVVLTKEEVTKLFDATKNKKHRLILALLYSAGLRLNELLHLKTSDMEIGSGYGWVRNGKGGKDRLFIVAEGIKEELRRHISSLQPGSLIFAGRKGMLHPRTIQEIVKQAAKKALIQKNVHPHTLRHSFATHIIENGYDVTAVQNLLGHASPQTSFTYIHTASKRMISVKSPYDSLAHDLNGSNFLTESSD